jgi:hypothetical protein
MAEIAHAFTEQNTNQTTSSISYVDVTGANIASGNFTVGKKYLLYITAQLANSLGNRQAYLKVLHGSTDFAESESNREQVGAGVRRTYTFLTVWTAVSGEAIKLQFHASNPDETVGVDQVAMLAINLSDDVTEDTDWFFNERSTDDTLSGTPTDGASITFTPGTASDDWLVLVTAQYDPVVDTDRVLQVLDRSGEATSSLPQADVGLQEADSSGILHGMARVFTLGAASNTFKEKSTAQSGSPIRLHSTIFALNLNKFDRHAFAYTEADENLSATDYATELQTASITPTVTGDVWMGAYWGFDKNAGARLAKFRVQVDNSDQPAGQTTDAYDFRYDSNYDGDEDPFLLSTLANLSNAAHTVDLDASVDDVTGTPAGQQRTIWAVTMELAAVGDPAEENKRRSSFVPHLPLVLLPTDPGSVILDVHKQQVAGVYSGVTLTTLQTATQGNLFGISLGAPVHAIVAGAVTLTQTAALAIALAAPTHAIQPGAVTLTQATPLAITISSPTHEISTAITLTQTSLFGISIGSPVHTISPGPVTLAATALPITLSSPLHTVTAGPVTLTQGTPLAVVLGSPIHAILTAGQLTQGTPLAITLGAPTHAVTAGPVTLTQATPLAVNLGAPTHAISSEITLTQGTPLAISLVSPTHAAIPGLVVLAAAPLPVQLGAPTHAVQPGAVTLQQATPLAAALSAPVHAIVGGPVTLQQATPLAIQLGSPTHLISKAGALEQTVPLVITLSAPQHRIFYRGHVREDLRRAAGLPIPHREAME